MLTVEVYGSGRGLTDGAQIDRGFGLESARWSYETEVEPLPRAIILQL